VFALLELRRRGCPSRPACGNLAGLLSAAALLAAALPAVAGLLLRAGVGSGRPAACASAALATALLAAGSLAGRRPPAAPRLLAAAWPVAVCLLACISTTLGRLLLRRRQLCRCSPLAAQRDTQPRPLIRAAALLIGS
jgi:hypothetical protein